MNETAINTLEKELGKAKQQLIEANETAAAARRHLSQASDTVRVWESEVDGLQKALAVLKGSGK